MYTNFQPPNVTKRKLAPCLCTYWFCLRLTNTKREIEYFGFINQAQEYKCYFFSINLLLTIFQLSFKLTNDTVQFYNTTLYLATSPPQKKRKKVWIALPTALNMQNKHNTQYQTWFDIVCQTLKSSFMSFNT